MLGLFHFVQGGKRVVLGTDGTTDKNIFPKLELLGPGTGTDLRRGSQRGPGYVIYSLEKLKGVNMLLCLILNEIWKVGSFYDHGPALGHVQAACSANE